MNQIKHNIVIITVILQWIVGYNKAANGHSEIVIMKFSCIIANRGNKGEPCYNEVASEAWISSLYLIFVVTVEIRISSNKSEVWLLWKF